MGRELKPVIGTVAGFMLALVGAWICGSGGELIGILLTLIGVVVAVLTMIKM